MNNLDQKEMVPWYNNFKGTITKSDNGFITKGIYQVTDDKVIITELPIGLWTDNYKEYLETLIQDSSNKTKRNFILDLIRLIVLIQKFDLN